MTSSLVGRIAFTIGALLLFRLGEYIPLPGVNPEAWEQIFQTQASGILGMFNVFSGGGIHRMAIFALNIMPYISASIIIQLMTTISSALDALKKAGEQGRKTINQYTRYLTVVLAAFQAYGIAIGLEGTASVVSDPGWFFRISTVITLTGGTIFLMWLAEQITARGIGNGIALILLTGIVAELPAEIAAALVFMRQHRVSSEQIVAVTLIAVAVTTVVVAVELARRRVTVRFSARTLGARQLDERGSDLSLKLNPAGMVPVLLASFVMSVLVAVLGFFAGFDSSLIAQLRPAATVYLVLYALLIILCTFFYTASVLDPDESAQNLNKLGGSLPGISPGEPTAACLDQIVSRTTLIGAIYLALVCLLPDLLIRYVQVPVYFGGTALLITACSLIDLRTQFQAERRLN